MHPMVEQVPYGGECLTSSKNLQLCRSSLVHQNLGIIVQCGRDCSSNLFSLTVLQWELCPSYVVVKGFF